MPTSPAEIGIAWGKPAEVAGRLNPWQVLFIVFMGIVYTRVALILVT